MMKKHVIAIVLVVCMLCILLPITATATEAATETVASGTCGKELTWVLDDRGFMTISGTGPMDDYTATTMPWYDYRSDIWYVSMEEGITTVGEYAFYGLERLEEADIPYGVTSIGMRAFAECTNLSGMTLPHSIMSIGVYAFSGCENLSYVTTPDDLTSIGEGTFYGCHSLGNIILPDGMTSIGDYAFLDCYELGMVTFREEITSIGKEAFAGCTDMGVIEFYGDVPTFGDDAFKNVTLKAYYPGENQTWTEEFMQQYGGTITWEPYVVAIASGTCGTNVKWTLDGSGTLRIFGTGNMFSYSNTYGYTSAPWQGETSSIKTVIIESGVTSIGSASFVNCENISSISIPETVERIGADAFYRCSSLTKVSLPTGLTQIGENAFYESGITEINIPSTVTSVGEGAFYNTPLTSIILPQSVTAVSSYSFYKCDDLTSVSIQGALTEIGEYAFYGCTALEHVTFMDGLSGKIEEQAFAYCRSLKSFEVPVGTKIIGKSAFSGCTSLAEVSLPEGLESIWGSAFSQTALVSLCIPSTVDYIDSYAFSACEQLENLTMYSATVEGTQALSVTKNLAYVHVIGDVPAVDNAVFGSREAFFIVYYDEGTSGWTQPTWQGYLTEVWGNDDVYKTGICGENLTWKLDSAGTLTISGTGAMADYAAESYQPWYSQRTKITKVVIEDGVTSIGTYAFEDCSKLTTIQFDGDAPTFGEDVFSGVTATAYYPYGNKTWTEEVLQQYDGTITWTAYGEPEKFDVAFTQVELGNALNMRFAFPVSGMDDWTGAYAVATKTYADGREDVSQTVPAAEWTAVTISGAPYYYFGFTNISGKEMADDVKVVIYNADGEAVSNEYTDSIQAYIMRSLDEQNDETKAMLVDMLNYGAAAQEFYGYGTDNLANSLLSDIQKAYGTATLAECTEIRVKGENYLGTRLELKSSIVMQMAFSGLTADMTVKIEFTNHRGTVVSETVAPVETANGYVVAIDQMVVADGRQPITVTVYNADGSVYGSATDSMESYIVRMSSNDALYETIMKFSDSTYAYLH